MPSQTSRRVDPRLASAFGALRDAVGAIHNLEALVGSLRVGPRSLEKVIPDVSRACAPMATAAADLAQGATTGPLAALEARFAGSARELEAALGSFQGALRARDRLALERSLRTVATDLDGAIDLAELLVESTARGRVPVDPGDVVREAAARPAAGLGRAERLPVTFADVKGAPTLSVNPRLAVRLFAFAAALGAGSGRPRRAHVSLDFSRPGWCALRVAAGEGPGAPLSLPLPTLLGLSREFAATIARESGAALEIEAAGASVVCPTGT